VACFSGTSNHVIPRQFRRSHPPTTSTDSLV
jgi:hypothetical protein